jgi:hypothetical protein
MICPCVVIALSMICPCVVLALSIFCPCSVLALFLLCHCSVLALFLSVLILSLLCPCIVLVLFLHCSCSVYVLSLFRLCSSVFSLIIFCRFPFAFFPWPVPARPSQSRTGFRSGTARRSVRAGHRGNLRNCPSWRGCRGGQASCAATAVMNRPAGQASRPARVQGHFPVGF